MQTIPPFAFVWIITIYFCNFQGMEAE